MKINEIFDPEKNKQSFDKLMKSAAPVSKAGIIPYTIDAEGIVKMLFMVSSDPAYGGAAPQIAKGHVDAGENVEQAACREGQEELGLRQNNIEALQLAKTITISGMTATYPFSLYVAKVKDPGAFDQPGVETEDTIWCTLEQFRVIGRKSQLPLVTAAHSKMR